MGRDDLSGERNLHKNLTETVDDTNLRLYWEVYMHVEYDIVCGLAGRRRNQDRGFIPV